MTTTIPPYADRGVAAFEVLDSFAQNFLLNGSNPPLSETIAYAQLENTNLAQFTVVGRDSSGFIVKAVRGTHTPIGVIATATSVATGKTGNAQVWVTGHFNIDALVWDSSWDTDAKKLAAFDAATGPTLIRVSKRTA